MSLAAQIPSQNQLVVENLTVHYGAVQALHNISFTIPQGKIVTLIGSNGAGKSTTLRAISGMRKPTTGKIFWKGESLLGLRAEQIVTRGIAQAPEGRGIFLNLTVKENLELGAYTRSDKAQIAADLEHVFTLLPRLKERFHQNAGTMSGGEQQMLAIGRALMAKPDLLLLDEPSLGLAPQITERIFEIIARVNGEGMTVLLVEQNALIALEVAHEGLVLETGTLVTRGLAQDLLSSDDIKRAYLGEN